MSRILTREERLFLPDWEEINDFFQNPANAGENIEIAPFMNSGIIHQMVVSKLDIVIYTKGLGAGAIWQQGCWFLTKEENYIQACQTLERIYRAK